MLNKSGESEHLLSCSCFKELNALSSSAIEYISYGLVIYGIYVEVCSFITHTVESFIIKGC